MEKQLTISVQNAQGEEGLSAACREGRLFRNDPELEDLYRDGFRVYNYDVVEEEPSTISKLKTLVRVFLKK